MSGSNANVDRSSGAPAKEGKLKSFFSRFSGKHGQRTRSATWHGSEAPRSQSSSSKAAPVLPYAPTAQDAGGIRSPQGAKLNPFAKYGYGTNPRMAGDIQDVSQSSVQSAEVAAGTAVVAAAAAPAVLYAGQPQARTSVLDVGRFESTTGTTRGMLSGIGPVSSGYTVQPLSATETSSTTTVTPGQPLASASSQATYVTPGQPLATDYEVASQSRSQSPNRMQYRSFKSEAQEADAEVQSGRRFSQSGAVQYSEAPRHSLSTLPAVAERDLVYRQILLKETESRLGVVKTTGLDAKRAFGSAAQTSDTFLNELSALKFQSIPPQLQDFCRSQKMILSTMQQYHNNMEQFVLIPSGAMTDRDAEVARALAAKKGVQSASKDLDSAKHSYDKLNPMKRDRVLAAQTNLDEATQRYHTAAGGFIDAVQTLEQRKVTVFGTHIDFVMSQLAAGLKDAVAVIESGLRERSFSPEEFAARQRSLVDQQRQSQWHSQQQQQQQQIAQQPQQQFFQQQQVAVQQQQQFVPIQQQPLQQQPVLIAESQPVQTGHQHRLSYSEAEQNSAALQAQWEQQQLQQQQIQPAVTQGPIHHQVPLVVAQPAVADSNGGGQIEPAISRLSTDAITDVSWRPTGTNVAQEGTMSPVFPQQQVFSSPPSSVVASRKSEGQSNPVPTSSMYPPQNAYSQGFVKQLPTLKEEQTMSGEQSLSSSPIQFRWDKETPVDSEEESGLEASSKRRRSRVGVFPPQGEETSAQALISPRNQPPGLSKRQEYDFVAVGVPSAHSDLKREIV